MTGTGREPIGAELRSAQYSRELNNEESASRTPMVGAGSQFRGPWSSLSTK